MRRRQTGFTLLEAIVTLVIVALVVTILMQALQQAIGLRTRLLRHEREARLGSLQEQWFRDTVQAAQSDFPDALGPMRGDASQVSFLSAAPLGGGGLVRVTWRLQAVDGGESLVYGDGRWQDLPIITGPLHDAAFAYLDKQGRWIAEWNGGVGDSEHPDGEAGAAARAPGAAPLPELPRMLRLQATTATGQLLWLVSVPSEPRAPAELRPEELGIGL